MVIAVIVLNALIAWIWLEGFSRWRSSGERDSRLATAIGSFGFDGDESG